MGIDSIIIVVFIIIVMIIIVIIIVIIIFIIIVIKPNGHLPVVWLRSCKCDQRLFLDTIRISTFKDECAGKLS